MGPCGQSERFVCSALAKQIAEVELGRREPVHHVGNLEARSDFLDVRDVFRAYRLASQGVRSGRCIVSVSKDLLASGKC